MHKYKYLAATALVCLFTTPVFAQSSTAVSGAGANSSSQSGALAVAGSGNSRSNSSVAGSGNSRSNSSLTINNPANTTANVNSTVSGTTTVKTNPAVFAPGLTAAGLETCLGSASGGLSVVGFGLTGGSSYPDEGCQARLDARTLWSMGLKGAALVRLCQREQIYRSMPDVCDKYIPRVQPVGYPAPVIAPTRYAGGPIMLVDGNTGRDRMCNDYNEAGQKCRLWADAKPVKHHTKFAAKPLPQKQSVAVAEPQAPATVAAAPTVNVP